MLGGVSQLLDELRPAAFAIAYRMLGSVAEAEDVVQEALLRFHRVCAAGESIESPRAYVATIATRLAIDELRSARVRRETYVGEWLPEPLIGAARARAGVGARAGDGVGDVVGGGAAGRDPAERAERAESLSFAFLVLLETLSPEQRAVLLLHDVFDYGYDEIAAILGTTQDNARQLAVRARRHVATRRPRFEVSGSEHAELARRFFAAAQEGDLAGSRRCSPTTSSCTGTAAARCRRWRDPSMAAAGSPGPCSPGRGRALGSPGRRCGRSLSTASRARYWSTATVV